ncbi:MAG: CRTAC1 family protein, partial [Bryobacteraceae bacterium]
AGEGYSMGAAVADFDNDGDADLFIAGVSANTLYRNRGDGRFENVTRAAGIKSAHWSVGAGWFDYENDGLLDLFVVNYAKWSPSFDRFCGDRDKAIRVYCHPRYFEGLPNTLYRNRGDGTFEDVSAAAGIAKHIGRGMSVVFADYDGDGYLDVFVPNDKLPNFLFHNRGGKGFEEVGLQSGAALADHGKAISGMGADFRDFDNDGLPDILFTALNGETFPLLRNTGKGEFRDATYSSKLGPMAVRYSGWGVGFYDLDNDGWKDIFSANSHVNDRIDAFEPSVYKQPSTIFLNRAGTFEAGPTLPSIRAHRGSAIADLDGDGQLDIVVTSLGEAVEIWHNSSGSNWLEVRLQGTKSNRDGIGAEVRIGKQLNQMTTAVGYASSVHAGVHFGLGSATEVDVEVRWPSGIRQTLKAVNSNQVLKVTEPAP